MGDRLDYSRPCPACQQPVGEHTIDGYRTCLESVGYDHNLPYEDDPGEPLRFPAAEGRHLVGEVTVAAATIDTDFGHLPALQFTFTGPGAEPMSRRSPVLLVMDADGLRAVRQLVGTAVAKAIGAAQREGRS